MQDSNFQSMVQEAAHWIHQADGLLIIAGANMGEYARQLEQSPQNFTWSHPPLLGTVQMRFLDLAMPEHFINDPELTWGFFGHCLQLSQATKPAPALQFLHQWGKRCRSGAFVLTSDVDSRFQKAGFSNQQVVECHGSIHHLQCCQSCDSDIWPVELSHLDVDLVTSRLLSALPRCPKCNALARPNVLLYGDFQWLPHRANQQLEQLKRWRKGIERLVVIELGNQTTVRNVLRDKAGPLPLPAPHDVEEKGTALLDVLHIPRTPQTALPAINLALQQDDIRRNLSA